MWFDELLQIFGITLVLPIIGLVGCLVFMCISPYNFPGYGWSLERIVSDDLLAVLENAIMTNKEKARLQMESTKLQMESTSRNLYEIQDDLSFQEVAAGRLLAFGDDEQIAVARIRLRRATLLIKAQTRIRARLMKTPPMLAVRIYPLWIVWEQAKVVLYATCREGIRGAIRLLIAAGEPVTSGSVGGLILGVLQWYFLSKAQGSFLDTLGRGVTFGAFIGLGYTLAITFNEIFQIAKFSRANETKAVTIFALIYGVGVFGAAFIVWFPQIHP